VQKCTRLAVSKNATERHYPNLRIIDRTDQRIKRKKGIIIFIPFPTSDSRLHESCARKLHSSNAKTVIDLATRSLTSHLMYHTAATRRKAPSCTPQYRSSVLPRSLSRGPLPCAVPRRPATFQPSNLPPTFQPSTNLPPIFQKTRDPGLQDKVR
jgi:hypothetical protein